MFIKPEEHILLMDLELNRFSLDELKQLANIGLKTVYYHGALEWNLMQPTADSPINFDRLDQYVRNVEAAGLKTVVPFVYHLPPWKPDDWFFSRERLGIPSYTNPETGADLDAFANLIIGRYDPKIFQLIYAMPADGEFPVHFDPISPLLPFPNSVLVDFVVARQKVLAAQSGEVWTAFHCYTRPVWWHDLYSALQREFPDCNHYGIQFTYYIHDSRIIYDWIADTSSRYGIKYFGGSEYCQGLRKHTPLCIAQKQHGFITAPIHIFQTHNRLEPWMLDELTWAIEQLKGMDHA